MNGGPLLLLLYTYTLSLSLSFIWWHTHKIYVPELTTTATTAIYHKKSKKEQQQQREYISQMGNKNYDSATDNPSIQCV